MAGTARRAQIPSGFRAEPLATIIGGEGTRFRLADGRTVLDASNTGGPLGHRHPRMLEALREAIEAPAVNEAWMWAGREQTAEDLRRLAFANDPGWFGGVRFCLSGSEANDLALSLAQALTGRQGLATRERAYHGASGLARDVTVQPQWHGGLSWRDGHVDPAPRTTPVTVLPAPIGERIGPVSPDPAADAERVYAHDVELAGVAAVIVDYSQGGVYHSAGHQDAVAELARASGALWIADEVVNAFGRCGSWFAFRRGTTRPDVVTLGKALGGGMPAGAVVVSQDVAERMVDASWQSGGTFRAHAVVLAAISAHLRIVVEEGLVEKVEALDGVLLRLLRDVAARHPSVRRIDGRGLHWTIELHGRDWANWTGATDRPTPAGLVQERALEAGALIATSGEETSLFLAPALIVDEPELERMVAALDIGLGAADELIE